MREEELKGEEFNYSSELVILAFLLSMLKLMDQSISDVDFVVLFILPNYLVNSSQQNVRSMVSME